VTGRITTSDAARIYHIPARTIRRWHTEGRTTDPVVVKGKLWWLQEEIDQLAHQRGASRLRATPRMTHHQQ
jgi:hypothetical protein